MAFEDLTTGSVIRYPYVWSREAAQGETEGRKDRPTAVGVRLPREDGDLIVLFPITSQPPVHNAFAVEIPEIEKRRAGLDTDKQLWIILDEYNDDVIGRSFYLEPEPPLGAFSPAFFKPLILEFIRRKKSRAGVSRPTATR